MRDSNSRTGISRLVVFKTTLFNHLSNRPYVVVRATGLQPASLSALVPKTSVYCIPPRPHLLVEGVGVEPLFHFPKVACYALHYTLYIGPDNALSHRGGLSYRHYTHNMTGATGESRTRDLILCLTVTQTVLLPFPTHNFLLNLYPFFDHFLDKYNARFFYNHILLLELSNTYYYQ